MQRIVLLMKQRIFADVIMKYAVTSDNPEIYYNNNYSNATDIVKTSQAEGLIIGVEENGKYNVDYCLSLCKLIRNEDYNCKLLLICPESKNEVIEKTILAKSNKVIDDFVFYESSIKYLFAVIDAL